MTSAVTASTLSQADTILENAPDAQNGKRWGLRPDFHFGQATQTLQGNPANEPRPEIYRNIFQAYNTYMFPVGRGFVIDFGKWASSLGIEGNYAKRPDQLLAFFLVQFSAFLSYGRQTRRYGVMATRSRGQAEAP